MVVNKLRMYRYNYLSNIMDSMWIQLQINTSTIMFTHICNQERINWPTLTHTNYVNRSMIPHHQSYHHESSIYKIFPVLGLCMSHEMQTHSRIRPKCTRHHINQNTILKVWGIMEPCTDIMLVTNLMFASDNTLEKTVGIRK